MYNWRKQKELLLGIEDPKHKSLMRYIMAQNDAKIIAEDEENKRIGYCSLCGRSLTTHGACNNILCANRVLKKPRLSAEEWFQKGCEYQLIKCLQVSNDCLEETLMV